MISHRVVQVEQEALPRCRAEERRSSERVGAPLLRLSVPRPVTAPSARARAQRMNSNARAEEGSR
jgi:hypothetical protein